MTAPMHISELPLRARVRLAVAGRAVPMTAAVLLLTAVLTWSAQRSADEASVWLGVAIGITSALFVVMVMLVWGLFTRTREVVGALVGLLLTAAMTASVATMAVWALPTCPRTGFEDPSRCTAPEAASWGLATGLSSFLGLLVVVAVMGGAAGARRALGVLRRR